MIPQFVLMKFRFRTWAVSAALLTFALFPVNSFASNEEDNQRLIFYGIGIGFGALMCDFLDNEIICLLYTSPSPRDRQKSRMPSSA